MKTKILLILIAVMTIVPASYGIGNYGGGGSGNGGQQVIVNNYYYDHGYEYASRIYRFHNSYVSFDFYSPLFTEVYWYHHTPYTWGVSIYDDWYYYGGGISRHSWSSGFGGSYWWGYDPWWDYDPWMGYGWNSWYAPGTGWHINYYLGRPYYHYPMAWNNWYYHGWDSGWRAPDYRPEPHYGPHGGQYNNRPGYNPSHPYDDSHRSGYTITGGRSSVTQASAPKAGTTIPRTEGVRRVSPVRTGSTTQSKGAPVPETPVRTSDTRHSQPATSAQSQTSADRAPAETPARQRTQSTVKSTSKHRSPASDHSSVAGTGEDKGNVEKNTGSSTGKEQPETPPAPGRSRRSSSSQVKR